MLDFEWFLARDDRAPRPDCPVNVVFYGAGSTAWTRQILLTRVDPAWRNTPIWFRRPRFGRFVDPTTPDSLRWRRPSLDVSLGPTLGRRLRLQALDAPVSLAEPHRLEHESGVIWLHGAWSIAALRAEQFHWRDPDQSRWFDHATTDWHQALDAFVATLMTLRRDGLIGRVNLARFGPRELGDRSFDGKVAFIELRAPPDAIAAPGSRAAE